MLFTGRRQCPHVLTVDPSTDIEDCGVRSEDLLVGVNGKDPCTMSQEELTRALKDARVLDFVRPKALELPTSRHSHSTHERVKGHHQRHTPDVTSNSTGGHKRARSDANVKNGAAHEGPSASEKDAAHAGSIPPRRTRSRSRARRYTRQSTSGVEENLQGVTCAREQAVVDDSPTPKPAVDSGNTPRRAVTLRPAPGIAITKRSSGGQTVRLQPRCPIKMPPWDVPESKPPDRWDAPSMGPPPDWRGPPHVATPEDSYLTAQCQAPEWLERNENGGASLVVERLPQSLCDAQVVNKCLSCFGPITDLRVNPSWQEAIVTFQRAEDAAEALKFHVFNDPSIGIRPWSSDAKSSQISTMPAASASWPSGNLVLESNHLAEMNRQREGVAGRRLQLLQRLTDQLREVMAKISNPETSERNRELLQSMLSSIKENITAMTPKTECEHVFTRPMPSPSVPSQAASHPTNQPAGQAPTQVAANATSQNACQAMSSTSESRRPATLLVSGLSVELRGMEARLRQALGGGIESVSEWSEDKCSCVVRFSDRSHAENAMKMQLIWGYVAALTDEEVEGCNELVFPQVLTGSTSSESVNTALGSNTVTVHDDMASAQS